MNERQFKTAFYALVGVFILSFFLPHLLFDFMELDMAFNLTADHFALPVLIFILAICPFIYLRFLRRHETKVYKSKWMTRARTIVRIIVLTFALTIILLGTTINLILLTNAYTGNSRIIHLNAKIVDYYSHTGRLKTSYYVRIQDPQLDRIVEFKVNGEYQVGKLFVKTMKIGRWGLLYSEE